MERRHFELDRGYLNIDRDALYFTRSGNWQEALAAPELHGGFSPRRTLHTLFGMGLIGARALFELLHLPTRGPEGLLLTAGVAGLGLLVLYRALRHDLAPSFRIPFVKLLSADTAEKGTTLRFLDGTLKERTRTVKMPPPALDVLTTWLTQERSSGG